jgi:hypothetical protein
VFVVVRDRKLLVYEDLKLLVYEDLKLLVYEDSNYYCMSQYEVSKVLVYVSLRCLDRETVCRAMFFRNVSNNLLNEDHPWYKTNKNRVSTNRVF